MKEQKSYFEEWNFGKKNGRNGPIKEISSSGLVLEVSVDLFLFERWVRARLYKLGEMLKMKY